MHDAPSKPPGVRRLRRPVLVVLGAVTLLGAAALALARHEPAFYRERRVAPAAEPLARRLVTKVAALQAALGRPGPWDAVLAEDEINAWLALDLPRNHAALLPPGVTEPRVRLEPGRATIAARVGIGPLAGVTAVTADVRLVADNRLEITVHDARLGAIPLPAGPFARRLATVLGRLGTVVEPRRLDGRSMLAVTMAPAAAREGRRPVLGALAIGDAELLVSGRTREPR